METDEEPTKDHEMEEESTVQNWEATMETFLIDAFETVWVDQGFPTATTHKCEAAIEFLKKHPECRYNFKMLVSMGIMEVINKLMKYPESSREKSNPSSPVLEDFSKAKKIKSDDTEVQEILANEISKMEQKEKSVSFTTKDGHDRYLVLCYLHKAFVRIQDERDQCTISCLKIPQAKKMLKDIQNILMKHTLHLMTGKFDFSVNAQVLFILSNDHSAILELMLTGDLHQDFLVQLVNLSFEKSNFEEIFNPVLRALFLYMQRTICTTELQTEAIDILANLVNIKVGQSRPFCDLIAKQSNFHPRICTTLAGREIVKCSYLGPFLSVSLFAEENVRFADAHGKSSTITPMLAKLRMVSFFFVYFLYVFLLLIKCLRWMKSW